MSTPEQITAVALLCDYGQVSGDKLNVMGAGWSYLWAAEEPAEWPLTLAVALSVPWAMTNQDIAVVTELLTEDGQHVTNQDDEDVRAEGHLRVGRPPDARAGFPIVVPFVLPFPPIPLSFGGYVFEITAGSTTVARVTFQVAQRRS